MKDNQMVYKIINFIWHYQVPAMKSPFSITSGVSRIWNSFKQTQIIVIKEYSHKNLRPLGIPLADLKPFAVQGLLHIGWNSTAHFVSMRPEANNKHQTDILTRLYSNLTQMDKASCRRCTSNSYLWSRQNVRAWWCRHWGTNRHQPDNVAFAALSGGLCLWIVIHHC